MTVAWGLLSTAAINRAVLAAARASKEVEVVAVASRELARADAYAREHGIERAYASYEELLLQPDVEAVYVSLPNSLHVLWSLRALEAGKHVLCEKPLTRRPGEVEHLFAVAGRAGRIVMEGFMYRHHPQTRTIADLVSGGAIGQLRAVHASFSFSL
ncbi:MAG: Gfo/Idh/MocA family oxidoreductase, partial [Actinomycetota bacterium]|nr:Gfo/Idh/MocA family oxidoreductase [Actinomycetota bacterium]